MLTRHELLLMLTRHELQPIRPKRMPRKLLLTPTRHGLLPTRPKRMPRERRLKRKKRAPKGRRTMPQTNKLQI
jgi:hypothetical protein